MSNQPIATTPQRAGSGWRHWVLVVSSLLLTLTSLQRGYQPAAAQTPNEADQIRQVYLPTIYSSNTQVVTNEIAEGDATVDAAAVGCAGEPNTVAVVNSVTVAAAQTDPNLVNNTAQVCVNKPVASLGNRVWNDANRNGLQDTGEVGVANVTVTLLQGCTGNTSLGTRVTNNTGIYGFVDINPGQYRVQMSNLPAGFVFSPQNQGTNDGTDSDVNTATGISDCITLAPRQVDNRWDAGINQPVVNNASLGDRVWNDANRNGGQDADEAGVPNVTVTLLSGCTGNTVVGTPVTTNANGLYSFTGLAAGQYRVQMSNLPAGFVFSGQNLGGNDATDSDVNTATGISDCITLAAGQNDPNWDAGINQPVVGGNNCLGDFIWNDLNKNGLQDAGETGVAGATINVENTSGTIIGSAVSDANGFYQICNLPVNETLYAQLIPPAGYIIQEENVGSDDTIDSDFSSLNGYTGGIRLTPGVNNLTIDGGIVLATGKIGDRTWEDLNFNGIQDPGEPGFSAIVQLYDGDKRVIIATQTSSGVDGSYLFTGLTAGDYYVCFSAPPGAPYALGLADQGSDDELDSDALPAIGCTDLFPLGEGETNLTIDAGFVDP